MSNLAHTLSCCFICQSNLYLMYCDPSYSYLSLLIHLKVPNQVAQKSARSCKSIISDYQSPLFACFSLLQSMYLIVLGHLIAVLANQIVPLISREVSFQVFSRKIVVSHLYFIWIPARTLDSAKMYKIIEYCCLNKSTSST